MELKQFFIVGNILDTPRSLQQLFHVIVSNALPEANKHNTRIVNEVNEEMKLDASLDKVAEILNKLLNVIVSNSKDGDIHISVDRYSGVVTVQIEERNNYNGYALASSINSLVPDAIEIGGYISIKDPRQKIATVSFSFPQKLVA